MGNFKTLHTFLFLIVIFIFHFVIFCNADTKEHMRDPSFTEPITSRAPYEENLEYWKNEAQSYILSKIRSERNLNYNKAKNIILFLGDGMSLATVAATRMYMGGEENYLSFEQFAHFGLAKTYAIDYQVSDSANTATAYLHGVKGNYETVGVNGHVKRKDCLSAQNPEYQTTSIAEWAQIACKATGFVTTSRVTHASPSGVYAHSSNRYWENDQQVKGGGCNPSETIDIGRQLIENTPGINLNVIMGGGRRELRDSKFIDEEGKPGIRGDDRDLIQQWIDNHKKQNNSAEYIWNKQQLLDLSLTDTDYVLGLFEDNHCMYNMDIINNNVQDMEPTLVEMTEAAVRILEKNENGYFLFVESARIDMGHHQNWARKALDETKVFSEVIQRIVQISNMSETLIVVTADHSHTMTFAGNPTRGNDILGLSGWLGSDGLPYTTLSYPNGLGYYDTYDEIGERKNVSLVNLLETEIRYSASVPQDDEAHGGDDVGVYASGPWSHLFVGNYEQNNIPVVMAYAAQIGPYWQNVLKCNTASSLTAFVSMTLISFLIVVIMKI